LIAILLNCDEKFLLEAEYVFSIFTEILGIPCQIFKPSQAPDLSGYKILIKYENSETHSKSFNGFLIKIFFYDYPRFLESNLEPKVRFIQNHDFNKRIPYFFSQNSKVEGQVWWRDVETGQTLINYDKLQLNCCVDLVSSAYHVLSLQNEACISSRDELGRFQRDFASSSEPVYDFPIVDCYCNLLFSFLQKASHELELSIVQKSYWPSRFKFAVCLTHDIDRLNTWTLSKVVRNLKFYVRKKVYLNVFKFIVRLFKQILSILTLSNWQGNFGLIVREEQKFGFNSSFYFVAGKQDSLDPDYELNSSRLVKVFQTLKKQRVEIGLHGSIKTADVGDLLKEEKRALMQIIKEDIHGGRQHFLRFVYPKTFENIQQADLRYDSTLGFATALGYRCGVSFPFKPFNRDLKYTFSFYEIPLHVMDAAIMKDENYTVLEGENFSNLFDRIEKFLVNARNYQGCLTLLWHNSNFDPVDVTGYTKLYREILKWAYEHGGWGCCGFELWDWWTKRSAFRLTQAINSADGIELNLSQFQTDTVFLRLMRPHEHQEFEVSSKDCRVTTQYEKEFLHLKLDQIKADSIFITLSPISHI